MTSSTLLDESFSETGAFKRLANAIIASAKEGMPVQPASAIAPPPAKDPERPINRAPSRLDQALVLTTAEPTLDEQDLLKPLVALPLMPQAPKQETARPSVQFFLDTYLSTEFDEHKEESACDNDTRMADDQEWIFDEPLTFHQYSVAETQPWEKLNDLERLNPHAPVQQHAPKSARLPGQFIKFGPFEIRPSMGSEVPIGRAYQPVPHNSISRLAGYVGLDEYSLFIREVPDAPEFGLRPSRNGIWVRQPNELEYRRLGAGEAERVTPETEVRVGGDGLRGETGLLVQVY